MPNDSEASPRPWRVHEADARVIVDANGKMVGDAAHTGTPTLSSANAALIVAAVNATWERENADRAMHAFYAARVEAAQRLPVQPTLRDVCDAAAAVVTDSFCARPQAHAPGCECRRL